MTTDTSCAEILRRLAAGETLEIAATAMGLDVLEDRHGDPMIALPGWTAGNSDADVDYPDAESGEEAAQSYVDGGDWGSQASTNWVCVDTWRVGYDAEGDATHTDRERHAITIEVAEPECATGEDHDWDAPHSIVGGIAENPGCWGHGGGVICDEVCLRCGCRRQTDTWAQDPETGEQGLTSVEYTEGHYGAEIVERRDRLVREACAGYDPNPYWSLPLVDVGAGEALAAAIRLLVGGTCDVEVCDTSRDDGTPAARVDIEWREGATARRSAMAGTS